MMARGGARVITIPHQARYLASGQMGSTSRL